MSNIKEVYPEMGSIQENLSSLKGNTIDLAKHVRDDGAKQADMVSDKIIRLYDRLKVQGARQLEKAEVRVKAEPAKSVAIAFAAGIVASYFLGRR